MSEIGVAPVKVCVVCGLNVADKPRVKDTAGRYMCKACAEKQTAAKPTTSPIKAPPPGDRAAGPKPAAKDASARVAASSSASGVEGGEDVDHSVMAALVASSKQATSPTCPNCKGWVKEGQAICTSCGYNLREGQQVKTSIQKEKAPVEKSEMSKAIDGGALGPIFWMIGACVGGALGVGLAYASASSGVISRRTLMGTPILIGICCGIGTTIAARDTAGMGSGIVAMIAAILALGIGRYMAVQELLDEFGMGGLPFDEWFFQTLTVWEGMAALLALFVAWKIGSTGSITGEG